MRNHEKKGLTFSPFCKTTDLEDVGQQLIEDNIVSVSRQMIDKEASVARANAASGEANGHAPNGHAAQKQDEMEVDEAQ